MVLVSCSLANSIIERMSLEKGRQEGEMVMLRRLLTQRFGPLSDGVEQRLHTATVQDLERWADRVLDAQHLDEVFRTSD
jgi:Domain of unknown function (DUF4351)